MSVKSFSDFVLVYDRGSEKKPSMFGAVVKRLILCCSLVLCAGMYIVCEYSLPISKLFAVGIFLLSGSLFTLIFVFVRKRFAVPLVAMLTALIVYHYRNKIWRYLSYFTDAVILAINGRIFKTDQFLIHNRAILNINNQFYVDGMILGITLTAALFSLVTAACLSGKIHVMPSLLLWIIFWIPALASEKLNFNAWIIPAAALYICVAVISLTFKDGPALNRSSSYLNGLKHDKMRIASRISKSGYRKRIRTRSVYYSKYYSAGIYAGVLFLLVGFVSSVVLRDSSGVDYTKLFEAFSDLGTKSGITSPFDSGPMSEYFTNPNSKPQGHSGLSINSPGNGDNEILRVTNDGSMPVYLRGDFGIDFVGSTWTSPVSDEPAQWSGGSLKSMYRPAELRVLQSLTNSYYGTESSNIVDSANVSIDYLCRTSVTFLPAYTSDFGYYQNDMFNIFGDYAVRVNENFDKMNTIRCTALVPRYINFDDSETTDAEQALSDAYSMGNNDLYESVYDELIGYDGAFSDYSKYVHDTYLSVPQNMESELLDYLTTNFPDLYGSPEDVSFRFYAAETIADYLRDNYIYSLDGGNNTSNPVMTFLNVTRSGHCALYASSMTLLLRELGIPARYCTGFAAKANDGSPQILRSKNLHAWCEVFLEGLGWTTFDPTSSSLDNMEPVIADSQPESSNNSSEVSESQSNPDSGESSESSEPENSGSEHSNNSDSSGTAALGTSKYNIIPYVLIISAIAAVILITALIIRSLRHLNKRTLKALSSYYRSVSPELLMEKILGVLRLCGLSPKNGELPEQFFQRVDSELDCQVSLYSASIECAVFGRDADCKILANILEKLYKAASKKLKFFSLIKLKKLICR